MYPKLMSVKEVADLLRIAPSTIYKMVADGDVDFVRYGSVIRIKPESLGITEMLPDIVAQRRAEMPVFDSILKEFVPELDRAFRNAPAYGEVGFKVVLHDSQVVRVETSTSVSKMVNKNGRS